MVYSVSVNRGFLKSIMGFMAYRCYDRGVAARWGLVGCYKAGAAGSSGGSHT